MRRYSVVAALGFVLASCGEAPTDTAPASASVPAAPALPAAPPPPPPLPEGLPPAPYAITCAEFAKVTEASLIEKFGAGNVVTEVISGPAGEYVATVVLPKHPTHRLEVTWVDSGAKSKVESATVGGGATSEWVGFKGLAVGMPLLDVEALNGKPFAMKNMDAYGWDGGGMVEGPTCITHAIFKVAGDGAGEFWSKDEGLRQRTPVVSRVKLILSM